MVETPAFISDAGALGMNGAERFEIVTFLAKNPDAGDVIAGTGGAYTPITLTGALLPAFLLMA